MAKTKGMVSETPYKPTPMLYLESVSGIKIPEAVKGKLGKLVSLLVEGKIVGQRLNQHAGGKKHESYDIEILKIKSSSKLGKIIGR